MNSVYKYLLGALLIGGIGLYPVCAQQLPISNQYLLNGYSLSPAYAGANENVEGLLSYRKDWTGVNGSPESRLVSVNGSLPKILGFLPKVPSEMGIGASISSEESGIFRTNSFSLTYAYKIKIAAVQSVRLGVSLGILENNINLAELSQSGLNDPGVFNSNLRKGVFDACFGALYRFQNLDVGLVLPRLFEFKVDDVNSNTIYTLRRHYIMHASYLLTINSQFQLTPYVVTRATANSGLFYEAAAKVTYQQQMWLALMYRKAGLIGISVGGNLYNIIQMGYSYEFSGNGILGKSSGTHEISLGFVIGRDEREAPVSTPKKPYYNWVD